MFSRTHYTPLGRASSARFLSPGFRSPAHMALLGSRREVVFRPRTRCALLPGDFFDECPTFESGLRLFSHRVFPGTTSVFPVAHPGPLLGSLGVSFQQHRRPKLLGSLLDSASPKAVSTHDETGSHRSFLLFGIPRIGPPRMGVPVRARDARPRRENARPVFPGRRVDRLSSMTPLAPFSRIVFHAPRSVLPAIDLAQLRRDKLGDVAPGPRRLPRGYSELPSHTHSEDSPPLTVRP